MKKILHKLNETFHICINALQRIEDEKARSASEKLEQPWRNPMKENGKKKSD